ncbi:MAG: hypothetical protein J5825_03425 [Lachnospiraceae bacterium]|nr:hypothetical protein [Lachnospiraceae bacterium]
MAQFLILVTQIMDERNRTNTIISLVCIASLFLVIFLELDRQLSKKKDSPETTFFRSPYYLATKKSLDWTTGNPYRLKVYRIYQEAVKNGARYGMRRSDRNPLKSKHDCGFALYLNLPGFDGKEVMADLVMLTNYGPIMFIPAEGDGFVSGASADKEWICSRSGDPERKEDIIRTFPNPVPEAKKKADAVRRALKIHSDWEDYANALQVIVVFTGEEPKLDLKFKESYLKAVTLNRLHDFLHRPSDENDLWISEDIIPAMTKELQLHFDPEAYKGAGKKKEESI